MLTIRILALAATIFLLSMILLLPMAQPHEAMPTAMQPEFEYLSWCCNGTRTTGDCQAIPASTVKPISGGFRIMLNPGDHHLVTRPRVYEVQQSETIPSPDGRYHACLYPTEAQMRCFYSPPMGF